MYRFHRKSMRHLKIFDRQIKFDNQSFIRHALYIKNIKDYMITII